MNEKRAEIFLKNKFHYIGWIIATEDKDFITIRDRFGSIMLLSKSEISTIKYFTEVSE